MSTEVLERAKQLRSKVDEYNRRIAVQEARREEARKALTDLGVQDLSPAALAELRAKLQARVAELTQSLTEKLDEVERLLS